MAETDRQHPRAPQAYAARDVQDATLAPPAAGELEDDFDEGEPSGGMQQGQDRTRWPEKDAARPQGRKTLEGNRERVRSGQAERGTP